jgi:Pyridine nucleotide-disulphide oxidoreductase, dimerisation domain/Biotin-requiring enzyme
MTNVVIKVPDMGDFDEVTVIELFVKVGDTIKVDQSPLTVNSNTVRQGSFVLSREGGAASATAEPKQALRQEVRSLLAINNVAKSVIVPVVAPAVTGFCRHRQSRLRTAGIGRWPRRLAAEVIAIGLEGDKELASVAFNARVIPSVACTDPEMLWVGLTETEAKAQDIKVKKSLFPWTASGRAIANGRHKGVTQLLFVDSPEMNLYGASAKSSASAWSAPTRAT